MKSEYFKFCDSCAWLSGCNKIIPTDNDLLCLDFIKDSHIREILGEVGSESDHAIKKLQTDRKRYGQ